MLLSIEMCVADENCIHISGIINVVISKKIITGSCRLKFCESLWVARWRTPLIFYFQTHWEGSGTIFDWVLFISPFFFSTFFNFQKFQPFVPFKRFNSHAVPIYETNYMCERWNTVLNRKVYTILCPQSITLFRLKPCGLDSELWRCVTEKQ